MAKRRKPAAPAKQRPTATRGAAPRSSQASIPSEPEPTLPFWLNGLIFALLLIAFLIACAHGVLEVHSSNDTYIGLAAGRDAMRADALPTTDRYSFLAFGQTWFNQNWVSHVYMWLLYDWFHPDAAIYGTWALGALTFTCVLLATRYRCGSWIAATIAAAVVATACRDWFSARPATMQFFLLSLNWLALMALMSQREDKPRWWPIALLVPIFVIWPHAHGSFIFGFGITGIFAAVLIAPRLIGWRSPLLFTQAALLVGVVLLAIALGAMLSPFGTRNLTHFLEVVDPQFRTVGEWRDPFSDFTIFPNVTRFWIAFAVGIAAILATLAIALVDRVFDGRATIRPLGDVRGASAGVGAGAFDLLSILLGIVMVFGARRFAPLFYILATPALVAWMVSVGATLLPQVRLLTRLALVTLTFIAAIFLGAFTYHLAHDELLERIPTDRPYSLLDRVTVTWATPQEIIEFLGRNEIDCNVVAGWTQGGELMFRTDGHAKVFIDGRSQQVYTLEQFNAYQQLYGLASFALRSQDQAAAQQAAAQSFAALESIGMDTILDRNFARLALRRDDYRLICETRRGLLLMKQRSAALQRLIEREQAGELWWPPDAYATQMHRALLHLDMRPPKPDRAAELLQQVVERDPATAPRALITLANLYIQQQQAPAGLAYVAGVRARAQDAIGDENDRDAQLLLRAADAAEQRLRAARTSPTP